MKRRLTLLFLVVVLIVTAYWLRSRITGPSTPATTRLVATLRAEPRSFNRLLMADRATSTVSQLVHESLVRINHATQALEPALASAWTPSADGRRIRVTLRPGLRFADGSPLTADDVVFSLGLVFDPRLESALKDSLTIGGAPITATASDATTLDVVYPEPYGPGLRPLHALPILPRGRYATPAAQGTLTDLWTPSASPGGMVGAGPFIVTSHQSGAAIELARNPHYWRTADDGTRLPRVDGLRLEIVPSQDAEMQKLRQGEVDITTGELRVDDVPEAKAMAARRQLQLFELGPALDVDMLWFSLAPNAPGGERRAWLRRRELREAIAMSVDRAAFVNAVYRGEGVQVSGVITPGNKAWHTDIAPRPYSIAMAGELLDRIGVRDRDGNGVREDVYNQPAHFTVLVQQGHTMRQRAAAVIQESLRAAGLQMEIVGLDPRALLERLGNGQYDAMFHALPSSDTDPSGLMEFWLSSGRFHLWHPMQKTPATPWERELDALMTRQLTLTDQAVRATVVRDAQRVLDREFPVIAFATPRVTVATSARVTHVQPGLLTPAVLWNAAELGVR